RRQGVPTPLVLDVDTAETQLTVEYVGENDLRTVLDSKKGMARVRDVADHLATLHEAGIAHGDPTTRNVRVSDSGDVDRTYLNDFGLGHYTDDVEDHAMDCHVFEQSLAG